MADHRGERASERFVCRVCGLSWRTSPPAWLAWCPGVTIYAFAAIPADLTTRTQLAREGLCLSPDMTPAGCYVAWTRKAVVLLYDRRQVIPKRVARSDRERAAQAEGARRLLAVRTCTQCGAIVRSLRYLIRPTGDDPASPRLCASCYEAWEYTAGLRALYHEARELLEHAAAPGGRPLRVLDTETTGLEEQDEPIELAIVDGLSGTVLLDSRLRPVAPISPGAYAVHGVSAAELQDAPALAEIWPRVCELLSGARVIAYNVDFDRQMLAQTAQRYGLRLPACRWYCLMEACSVFDTPEDGRWLSLSAVCAELEVQNALAHSARADALSAFAVVQALAARATV